MARIIPALWYDSTADEAVAFYLDVFGQGRVLERSHYPTEDLPDFQRDMAGRTLTVEFELLGARLTAINADNSFVKNPSISLMVNFDPAVDDDAQGNLQRIWDLLAADGQVLMPLGTYPFSKLYGWVQDKFAMSWQLILTDPTGDPRPPLIPALLFSGAAVNRAGEATDRYLDVFSRAGGGTTRLATRVPYHEPTGPAVPGSVMFSDFQLAGQWLVAMDSAVDQPSTFNEGVSLQIMCDAQDEIDYFWDALSRDPAAEVCGWCRDEFGLSWQITPANMLGLLKRPGAYQKMLSMKKIMIDEF